MARFNHVMLINPTYSYTLFTTPVVPVGIGYIAESLNARGIGYSVLDMTLGYSFADLEKHIRRIKPDLIGISMMSLMYREHYRMANFIKGRFPLIPVVVGGPHVSSCREAVLADCSSIDFGILQEGEFSLPALCEGKNVEAIPGLLYRAGSGIACSTEPIDAVNLDALPFPKYEHFELSKYGFGISIVSSRGCPYMCIYCSAHAIRNKFRARTAGNVVDEMEYWYGRGYREFDFQEDNPTFDQLRLLELCDQIEKRGLRDVMIMCGNGIRADRINRQLLKRMKEVGFKRLAFGVEAGNDRILKNIKKGESIDVIKNAIRDACDLGFFVSLFFVVGAPGETAKDVEDSMNIALSYPISHVNFFNLIPLPRTELFEWVHKNNYFILKPEIYLNLGSSLQMGCQPVFATPEFSRSERVAVLRRTKKIERFIKKRTIENKFKSLYPFNKLIGWLYMRPEIQKVEILLMRHPLYRKTIGFIKRRVRDSFYKDDILG